jgi:maltose O-acetyltransferase
VTLALSSGLARLGDVGAVLRAKYYFRSARQLGKRVRLWGHPSVYNDGDLRIGDRARLVSTVATLELAVGPDATLDIGSGAFINYGCSIGATLLVRIGPNTSIGTHVIMMDNDFHRVEPERRQDIPDSRPIVLEENVWLGARVIVLRGVTIGAHSVVAAGSVVTRDVPARTLVSGVPAKVVRSL